MDRVGENQKGGKGHRFPGKGKIEGYYTLRWHLNGCGKRPKTHMDDADSPRARKKVGNRIPSVPVSRYGSVLVAG